jgi:hypothetical protein
MDYRQTPNLNSAGWACIKDRRDVPGVVAMMRDTGNARTLGPETADEVASWVERVGWEPSDAPVLLARIDQ